MNCHICATRWSNGHDCWPEFKRTKEALAVANRALFDSNLENARFRAALVTIRDGYDHDSDAHKYGTKCRVCTAELALK